MLKKRLIPCLILRDGFIVQSFEFKRFLPIGKAKIAVEFVVNWDVDEIVLLDITATRNGAPPDTDLIRLVSDHCFVPLTVGGGIHALSDIREVMRAGADKVSINSEALKNPSFIKESSDIFGSQCIVVSVDVRINPKGRYEVVADSGKKYTGLHPVEWAQRLQELGAGEIFLNSVNRDGSRRGYDLDLVRMVSEAIRIPVIACGGVGEMSHLADGIRIGKASAVSAANIFQHMEHSTIIAKAYMKNAGIDVRLNTAAKYGDFEFDERGRLLKKRDSSLEEIWFERSVKENI